MYKSTHMIFFYVYCENFMVYYSFSERNSVSFIYFDLLSGLCSHYCVLLHPQCHLVYFTLCCLISEPEKKLLWWDWKSHKLPSFFPPLGFRSACLNRSSVHTGRRQTLRILKTLKQYKISINVLSQCLTHTSDSKVELLMLFLPSAYLELNRSFTPTWKYLSKINSILCRTLPIHCNIL